MSVRKVITTILCENFYLNCAMALTSATDTVQVVDITEDEEGDMPCADTEEGMPQFQTLAVFYIQPSLFLPQNNICSMHDIAYCIPACWWQHENGRY